jgi:enolase
MRAFAARAGSRMQVIGDDYLVTSADRIAAAARAGACNAVLLKPNQAGTITETKAALEAACTETEDQKIRRNSMFLRKNNF